jgi:hypothetical protein
VNWGDGTPATPGSVSGPGASGLLGSCPYTVTAGHTYRDEVSSPYTVSVTVGSGSTPITGRAAVLDAPLTAAPAATLSGTANAALSSTVAAFADANVGATAADFAAQVDWGDGDTGSVGAVTAVSPGVFAIAGGHTYARSGTFSVTIQLIDDGGAAVALTATAHIAPASSGGGGGPGQFKLRLNHIAVIRGSILSVRVACPSTETTCRGRLTASIPRGAGALALATANFILPGGSAATLDLRPTKPLIAAAAAGQRIRVTVNALAYDPTNGRLATASATAHVRFSP